MTIQHVLITDPDVHEPKGITSALSGTVYTANGSGSGSWIASKPLNVVAVNTIDDFPTAVSGVITLLPDTVYQLGADISTSHRFQFSNRSVLEGKTSLSTTLTYTGTSSMIFGEDVSSYINNISLDCPNGTIFNFADVASPGVGVCVLKNVSIDNCTKFGTFSDLNTVQISDTFCGNCDDGITIQGSNWFLFDIDRSGMFSTSSSFTAIDLTSSIIPTLNISSCIFLAPASAVGLSGLASSGNIPANFLCNVEKSTFTGGMTPLSGITSSDIRYLFRRNVGITDSYVQSLISIRGNSTETTISATNTPVKATGVFTVEATSKFSSDTTGKCTYLSEVDYNIKCDLTATIDVASGTGRTVTVYLAKNGTIITNSGVQVSVDSGDPVGLGIVWLDTLTTNDYIEIFVENNTSTTNIILVDAQLRLYR